MEPPPSPRLIRVAAVATLLAAAVPVFGLRGYTVDDALIIARVAHHVAGGVGYRFNAHGPAVDAVTPLGYPYLLAPFARASVLATLAHARVLGAAAWLGVAAWLGATIARLHGGAERFSPLLVLALCAPLGAWAVSGMETGVVTALATLALAPTPWGALAAGLAAAWRPELIPWAIVVAPGTRLALRAPRRAVVVAALLAVAPAIGVACARAALFGNPAPLAVFAKPSDLDHGLRYALGALAFTGPAWLLIAPRALLRVPARLRVVALAALVHSLALVLAGGDWMALWRLEVPVLPGMLLVGAAIAAEAPLSRTLLRTAVACGVELLVLVELGPASAHVLAHRTALVAAARPALRGATRVAAVDVGWVGAAVEPEADVVDLAGVTEPDVAWLPGGHTSKRLPGNFLDMHRVDAAVLLLGPGEALRSPWWTSRFAPYPVDSRVAALAAGAGFRAAATLPLGGTRQSYLIVRRTRP